MEQNKKAADCVISGGTIYTMEAGHPVAEAMAIKNGKIVYVGDAAGARGYQGSKVESIDLKGRIALPGFIEPHGHISIVTQLLGKVGVDCRNCRSIKEIIETLRAAEAKMPAGKWLFGVEYDESKLKENRHLTRYDLDEVSRERPIWVRHANYHNAVVNSVILQAAGISAATPDPPDGQFGRDESGEPTGFLNEFAAVPLIKNISTETLEDIFSQLKEVGQYYSPAGVTSVVEGASGLVYGIGEVRMIEQFMETEGFPFRYGAAIYYPIWKELQEGRGLSPVWRNDPEWARVFAVKLFKDGGLFTGPALSEPALSQNKSGDSYLLFSDEDFERMVLEAHSNGWQVWTHANGDLAIQKVLEAYEKAMGTHRRADPRHRIEHCQLPTDNQLDQMARLGVVPCFFPVHIWHWGDKHLLNLGLKQAARLSPMASALKRDLHVGIHNDSPFTKMDPLLNVSVAVTRRSMTGDLLGPEERISVEQALRAMTLGNAYLAAEEGIKGSLREGKLGDVVVLEADPYKLAPEEIKDIPIAMTIVGGNIVYEKN